MSLNTWKKEFLPKDISLAKDWDWKRVLKCSLKKYQGALSKNLKKHKVAQFQIMSFFYAEDCAACLKIWANNKTCGECLLYKIDKECCNSCDANSIWHTFKGTGDPKPMIKLIERAIKKLEKRKRKQNDTL